MTFDDLLRQALAETAEERAAQMMKVEKKHRFSLAYRLWERKALRDFRRGRLNKQWNLRKARYVVAALTAALSLLIGTTAYAAVVLFGRYGFVDKRDYSKLLIERHPSDKTTIEEYYGLPEEDGWKLISCDILQTFTSPVYERSEKKVSFTQNIILEGSMGNISTDKAEVEMLSLYTENDGFILVFRDDWCSIHWIYEGYLLSLDGNVTKNEAIDLALSTKKVNF